MDILPKETDSELVAEINRLQIELSQEKKQHEELQSQFDQLSLQYQQALSYIKQIHGATSSKSSGCLFIYFFILVLIFCIYLLLTTE
jgi:predicted PurR-regulated permease PerM